MKKGLRISGMNRSFLASSSTPAPLAGATPEEDAAEPVVVPTSMARRGLALSGAGRRLGISGMSRPAFTPPTAPASVDPVRRPPPDSLHSDSALPDDEVLP